MIKDFTLRTYNLLLQGLQKSGYSFQTFEMFCSIGEGRAAILRHDVDSWPANALQMAKIEAQKGVKASYYFRKSPLSYNEKIIKQIASLGHEIGYHYEDLTSNNGNFDKAIKSFERNLELFRKYYPVKTIAMHGKPLSKWNNLDLWAKYDFREYGIIGEPYLSIDFNKVLYLTDTGNCWDGFKYSLRDNVQSNYKFSIHSTYDLIDHLGNNLLPNQIMLNVHPLRWNDNLVKWLIRYYILTLPKYLPKKWLKDWRAYKKHIGYINSK
jgi:hypothetical protein